MGSMGETKRSIVITGAAGFIGQALAAALMLEPDVKEITLTDVSTPIVPHTSQPAKCTVNTLAADLTSRAICEQLFTTKVDQAYLLHGIMSGAAEANLDLGLAVNVDSMRHIVDVLKAQHRPRCCRIVFPSSLAVFGPSAEGETVTEATMPTPQSSYGAEKAMVELLFNDLSRRGLIDTRIVRLPTIIVRPGKPTGAASSFCSGIIREPLNGESSSLPVSRELRLWVCSARTIIQNLLVAMNLSEKSLGLGSRITNLPGRTVTVGGMLEALKEVGGSKALSLVEERYDERVASIVSSWPAAFDVSRAKKLGFQQDVDLRDTVKAYMEDYM